MARWIHDWNPDDETFWNERGRAVARRNLIWSIFAEHLGFSVWLLWSVVAVKLHDAGFDFSTGQLFTLVALPNLVGATMRFPYTLAVPRFGGRNWTVISALLLLVPVLALQAVVTRPGTPYWVMLGVAALAGLGGGNFASSMANISYFYPDGRKGLPLGLNAAGGNLGVSVVQLVVPGLALTAVGLVWVAPILLAAACAWLFMDNLATARSSVSEQAVILRRPHTWVMSWLYIGTFGSFIGYSAAVPLLTRTQFPGVSPAAFAFLGPLIGSLVRPVGGWLADRYGGARVTLWTFVAMIAGVAALLGSLAARSFPGFLTAFGVLFTAAGIGNGSTFRMIPAIFRATSGDPASARRESAAVLGFTSAVGAYGGFLIPQAYALSSAATGGLRAALLGFIAFYASCVGLTWWCYLRRRVAAVRMPSLAEADV